MPELFLQSQLLLGHLQHNRAFNSFTVEFTPQLIYFIDIPVGMIVVGRTSAGAVPLRKAVPTFISGIYVISFQEHFNDFRMGDTFVHVAHEHLIVAHELVARIQVARRRYRLIFRSHAAAGHSLVDARTAGEVDGVMVEVEAFPLLFPLQHAFCQLFILLAEERHILFVERVVHVRCADNRLDAGFLEPMSAM